MNVLKWIGWATAAALVVLTAGCHNRASDDAARPLPEMHGEVFPPDSDTRAVREVNTAQAAAGARQDATLYGVHFDAAGLNSLGQRKLDLMLSDETPAPLTVYLDLPADTAAAAARNDHQSVLAYLKDRGLQESQVALTDGPNPHASASAAGAITSLHAMDASNQNPQSGSPGNSTPVSQNATSAGNPQPTYSSH